VHTFLLLLSVPVLSASVPLSLVQLLVAAAAVFQIPIADGVLVLVWNFNLHVILPVLFLWKNIGSNHKAKQPTLSPFLSYFSSLNKNGVYHCIS
jgi:hypothetical protein